MRGIYQTTWVVCETMGAAGWTTEVGCWAALVGEWTTAVGGVATKVGEQTTAVGEMEGWGGGLPGMVGREPTLVVDPAMVVGDWTTKGVCAYRGN